MIEETLFNISYCKIQIDNFEKKKKELTRLLESYPEKEKKGIQTFATNRNTNRRGLMNQFASILAKELERFSKAIEKNFGIYEIWSVSYNKGDYQLVHNHGATGLSGLLYLDLPEDSPVTRYVQPWNGLINDTVQYIDIPIIEGDIVIVPSFVQHFSEPNKSNNKKRIISWDMKIL